MTGSLGKCSVRGCEREAMRVAVAIVPSIDPNGEAVTGQFCKKHYDEGVANYEKLYPKKTKGKGVRK